MSPILLSGGPRKLTLDKLLDIPFWLLAFGFGLVLMLLLVFLGKWRP